jgi:ATP-binding cassette, subfamily D (ALD), member 3
MFTKKLSGFLGFEGPLTIFTWYIFTGFVMKQVAPPFGKMTAKLQNLEGEYRSHHFDVLSHSEEIAFYNGS